MLPAGATSVLAPPAPNVLVALQNSWDTLRKRAHVLMVMDVSGSMGEPVPSAGGSKLEIAQEAAVSALDRFAPDDDGVIPDVTRCDRAARVTDEPSSMTKHDLHQEPCT